MKMSLTEKSLNVLQYLQKIGDEDVTAQDIADALGVDKKGVDGAVTRGLIPKGYAVREEAKATFTNDEGKQITKTVKFIKLTDAGKAYDHKSAVEADAE